MSPEEWVQIDYLLSQSAMGNHILFDMDQIKNVFRHPSLFGNNTDGTLDLKTIDQISQLFENLIHQPTLAAKKAFIDSLPETSRELIIRAYFNILDHTLMDKREYFH